MIFSNIPEVAADEVVAFEAGDHAAEPIVVKGGSGVIRSVKVVLGAGARLRLPVFVLGRGKLALTVDLAGAGAELHLYGLFIAAGMDADINVRVNHLASDTLSRQLVKGIATEAGEAGARNVDAEQGRGEFTGMIFVAKGVQRVDAQQYSRNIQLTPGARIVTRPQLEIYADDVKCSHGATVGGLDEEAIFYMRQRGVDEATARRMQLEGFVADIVSRCPTDDSRVEIAVRIDKLLTQ